MIRAIAGIVAAVLAAAVLLWVGHGTDTTPPPPAATQTAAAVEPRANGSPAVVPYRGLAIQVASGYKPVETYGPLIQEIADLGANVVLLSVAGYMEHATSQSIYIDARKVPPPEDFKTIIRQARQRGLKAIVMPIVLLRNPRGSEWRGVIEPPDWEDWWTQYREFVLYFADIAREGGADAMMVGSELVSTEKNTAKWDGVIQAVRERFAEGRLGYSANWDHYRPIEFWDKLDFIGMTSYYTLADKPRPTVENIVAKWEPIQKDVLDWQSKIGKPILMTEVGWCSQEGAAKAPWDYFQNQHATPEGMEEQRRLYEAFLQVWGDCPELLGVIWWEWKPSAGGPTDFGYTPKDKPAEALLRKWFAELQPATTTAPAADGE